VARARGVHSPDESYSGFWDGLHLRYGRESGLGVLVGFQPDLWNERPSTERPKASVVLDLARRGDAWRWSADVSAHQVRGAGLLPEHTFAGLSQSAAAGPLRLSQDLQVDRDPAAGGWRMSQHRGLRFVTIEKEELGGTVMHYPRKKLVMTRPLQVTGYGKLPIREIKKEELIDLWRDVARRTGLEVRTGETVDAVTRLGDHHFRVVTPAGSYEARRVILAIGRRGVPRKLGVPGEESPHVSYSLREPESYRDDHVLVVGGGDSAVEAALALAEQPGNEVRVSYRGASFNRIKPANQERITEAERSGRVELLWQTSPVEVLPGSVRLARSHDGELTVPASELFVFIGGELPSRFLRECGVHVETHFGRPR
jgi:thioredoxin reductase